MFKSSRKRQRPNFEEQLEKQLQILKEQTSTTKKKNKEVMELMEEAAIELQKQLEGEGCNPNEIKEMSSLDITESRNEPIKWSRIDKQSQQIHQDYSNTTIKLWNLSSNLEISELLKAIFPESLSQDQILVSEFIEKSMYYYYQLELQQLELKVSADFAKKILSTTKVGYLSINALDILAKKQKIQSYLIKNYKNTIFKIQQQSIDHQYKLRKHQQDNKEENIKNREIKLKQKWKQLDSRQEQISSKERNLHSAQRQLTLKQKDTRRLLEQKSLKLYESYVGQMQQKIKAVTKQMNHTQRNLRYKLEFLERKYSQMKGLKEEMQESQKKQNHVENEARNKLKKIERDVDKVEKRHHQEISRYEQEEKQLLKNITIIDEKYQKLEKKYQKQKDKVNILQRLNLELQQQVQKQLKQINQLRSAQSQQKAPQNNEKHKGSKTNRQMTDKNSKLKNKIETLIEINRSYEALLSFTDIPRLQIVKQKQFSQVYKTFCCLSTLHWSQKDNVQKECFLLGWISLICKYYFNYKQQKHNHILSTTQDKDILSKYSKKLVLNQNPNTICESLTYLLLADPINQQLKGVFEEFNLSLSEEWENYRYSNRSNLNLQFFELIQTPECLVFLVNKFLTQIEKSNNETTFLHQFTTLSLQLIDLFLIVNENCGNKFFTLLTRLNSYTILLNNLEYYCKFLSTFSHKKRQQNFPNQFFTIVEQLIEKLSIILQRLYLSNKNEANFGFEKKRVKKILEKLLQANENNSEYQMAVNNLRSMVSISQQY